ncbi:MAG: SLC13 family permease [Anaerolineae bacterium]
MTADMWITLAILLAAIVLFVTELLRVDVVALLVVVALILTGILTTDEAIAGFSNAVVLTIAALFVVGGAIFQTGLAAAIGQRILRVAGTDPTRLTIMIMVAVALLSGFISDTGVVAVMLPAIVAVSASAKLSPAKLMIPLAFGSLLGGASTLIGTPPNLIVTDLLREAGVEPFGFFSFTPMGVVLVAAGVLFMPLVGRHLLPERQPEAEGQAFETPKELIDRYHLPDNLFRLRVRSTSPLIGQTIDATRLGSDFDVSVISVLREERQEAAIRIGEQRISAATSRDLTLHPDPELELQRDDVLLVRGEGNVVGRAADQLRLAIQQATSADYDALVSEEVGVTEVVLPPRSQLIGRTLVDTRFGKTYRLTVLNITRPGTGSLENIKDTPLRFGDILLVQGEWRDIFALKQQRRDFVVMGETERFQQFNRRKAPIALIVLALMLVAMISGMVSVAAASMTAGLLMILTGCLTIDEAYRAVDWKSLVLIAGMLPMATAVEKVGLGEVAAMGFTTTLGGFGPLVILAGLFLLTSAFTQVLSNTATAVLVAPIALATAQQLGITPHAYMTAVAVAASMAFASPVASPVNTLVMGAGDYSFGDYLKVGIPMIGVMLVVTMIVLPLLWPF